MALVFPLAAAAGAGLSFFGLGVQPPSSDWGLQVNDARNFILTAWWIAVFPALAISSLMLGVNLLVDGLATSKRSVFHAESTFGPHLLHMGIVGC